MAEEGHDYKCFGHWYPRKVESFGNPDLSGIGVTIAFLLSSIASLIFIIYGTRRNLIFENPKHPFDHFVLNWLGSKNAPTGNKREIERRAFYAAIVAISDQQLFIGISFLIAGLTDCSLSIYSSSNIDAIAWLLLNVHFLTLVVLNFGGKSDRYNKKLKAVRIIAMGIMIALSLVMVVILAISGTNAWTYDEYGATNPYSVYYFLAPENYHSLPGDRALNVIVDLFFFSTFLIAYAIEIALFWDSSYWRYIHGGVLNSISFKFLAQFIYRVRLPPYFSYGVYKYIQTHNTWITVQKDPRLKMLARALAINWNRISAPMKYGWPRGIFFMEPFLPMEMDRSLILTLVSTQYAICAGLTRVYLCWIDFRKEKTETDILVWGPGQVIALISVIAPAIAWLHAKYEDENSEFGISDPLKDKTHVQNFEPKGILDQSAATLNAYFQKINSLWPLALNWFRSTWGRKKCTTTNTTGARTARSTSTGLVDQNDLQFEPPSSEPYDILASEEANAYSASSFYKLRGYIRYAKSWMYLSLMNFFFICSLPVICRHDPTLQFGFFIYLFTTIVSSEVMSYLFALVADICYLWKRNRKDNERLERGTGVYSLTTGLISPLGFEMTTLLECNVSESTQPILEHIQRPMIESNLLRRQKELVERLQEVSALEQKAIRSLEAIRKEVEAKELEIRMMRKETGKLEVAQDLLSAMELGIHELCASNRRRSARDEEEGCWDTGDIGKCDGSRTSSRSSTLCGARPRLVSNASSESATLVGSPMLRSDSEKS